MNVLLFSSHPVIGGVEVERFESDISVRTCAIITTAYRATESVAFIRLTVKA